MEQLGYLRANDGTPLYCAVHFPHPAAAAEGRARRYWPVVLAPPLFEERKGAYAPLRRLALALAAAGHAVLRFDYRGSGESGGAPALRRLQHLREDLATARRTLARLTGARDAVLGGLRFGATLALLETARTGGEAVLALAPLANGAAQVRLWNMRSKIRAELTGAAADEAGGSAAASTVATAPASAASFAGPPGTLDFDGFPVHPEFFRDVAALDLLTQCGPLSCPALLLQLSHQAELNAESQKLCSVLGPRTRAGALRIEPFWDKVDAVDTVPLETRVLQFLKEAE
jgi:pimeloyl-ACP methyl ester carboxylesterase